MKLLSLSALFTLFALLAAAPSAAQEEFKLNVDVDLVELHVTVVDDNDRPVGGLQQEHFRILEDKIEQPIAVFKQEDFPVSLGLVIDNSRSIEARKERLDASAIEFVRRSNSSDETFVVHFDFDARLEREFTSNVADLEQTLASVKPYGQTAVYDALVLALDEMQKAKYQKKAILLLTDGIDNASKSTLDEVVELVKRSSVMVFSIGLLSESGGLNAEESLIRISEASGGRAYFPENVDEARAVMQRIARDLREQYTLGYFPTNGGRDGGWRSVRVEIAAPAGAPQKLFPNYRHGYYGPER